MRPTNVTERLAALRNDFDRSFAEPARQQDVEYAELLAIHAGGRPYALRLSQASGVHCDRPVTPLPGPQAALLGVAGFSGAIVPVYDLAALLGHPVPERPRWLVLAGGTPPLALAFHELDGHVRVPISIIVGEPDGNTGRDVLRGMAPLPGGTRPIVDLLSARAVVHQLAGHITYNTEEG
jgi:purine-binding chemotaxis protein CheW